MAAKLANRLAEHGTRQTVNLLANLGRPCERIFIRHWKPPCVMRSSICERLMSDLWAPQSLWRLCGGEFARNGIGIPFRHSQSSTTWSETLKADSTTPSMLASMHG